MQSKELTVSIQAECFNCLQCGKCCNDMLVFLNCFDIARLYCLNSGWIEWLDFAELSEEEALDIKGESFPVRIDGKLQFAVLKMRAESSNCVFLRFSNSGFSECSAWLSRPLVCRTFPFEETESSRAEFIKEAGEFGCGACWKSKAAGSSYLNDLKRIPEQAVFDKKVSRVWNSTGTGKTWDFVNFIARELEKHCNAIAPGEI